MMKIYIKYIHLAFGLAMLTACTSQDEVILPADDDQIIHVGDVCTTDMVTTSATTRATVDAGSLSWLVEGLTSDNGMNIYYFKETDKQHAILKLENDGKYSLKTSAGVPCKWLGNGEHTFEGVLAPKGLKTQKDAQDYDDLIHYTAIPPSKKINATIDYISIPLQHRLARVQAYVLIDTDMGTTLKGYDVNNDENNKTVENTMLRFCNVKTLKFIDDKGYPVWKEERKAIPHYLGKLGSIVEDNKQECETFRMYKKKGTGELFFPTDGEWKTAHADYKAKGDNSDYICTDYGKVPSYDLIVRPTYSEAKDYANVMYDEDGYDTNKAAIEALENNIDFELTLDNGLEYEKSFTFDLNANDETVVFLRVSPERIDYNSTGSRLWRETSYGDAYYGVNNKNGNELSKAGSSWQRAYTNTTKDDGVTDGHKYNADTEDLEAQYVTNERFIQLLKEANAKGTHNGHYFILKQDIEINVTEFPADFVFTGHLDALDHTITLKGTTESRNWLFGGLGDGWTAEILNAKISGGVLFNPDPNIKITGHISNCWNGETRITDVTPAIPTY